MTPRPGFAILVGANQTKGVNVMSGFQPKRLVALQRGQNFLPESAEFEGLAPSEGREIVRIRFRLGSDRTLDILPSAEDLARLVQILSSFRGRTPAQMPEEVLGGPHSLDRNRGDLRESPARFQRPSRSGGNVRCEV